jgi:hypothetical protein
MAMKMMKNKKAAAPAKAPKLTPSAKPRTKGEVYRTIAEQTGLARRDVVSVFDTMSRMMAVDLSKPVKDRPKIFTVPGLMKVTARYKPPSPERRGIDPFTKEERTFKAKPASTQLKIRALKSLKSMV